MSNLRNIFPTVFSDDNLILKTKTYNYLSQNFPYEFAFYFYLLGITNNTAEDLCIIKIFYNDLVYTNYNDLQYTNFIRLFLINRTSGREVFHSIRFLRTHLIINLRDYEDNHTQDFVFTLES